MLTFRSVICWPTNPHRIANHHCHNGSRQNDVSPRSSQFDEPPSPKQAIVARISSPITKPHLPVFILSFLKHLKLQQAAESQLAIQLAPMSMRSEIPSTASRSEFVPTIRTPYDPPHPKTCFYIFRQNIQRGPFSNRSHPYIALCQL